MRDRCGGAGLLADANWSLTPVDGTLYGLSAHPGNFLVADAMQRRTHETVRIIAYYGRPDTPHVTMLDLANIQRISRGSNHPSLIVAGDFNLHDDEACCVASDVLIDANVRLHHERGLPLFPTHHQ
eukprot:2612910-Amphidinium_carterae.1